MESFKVGFIFTECFIQKDIKELADVLIQRLSPTGHKGELHNARYLFEQALFPFSQVNLKSAIENFSSTGQSVAVVFSNVLAQDYQSAIKDMESDAEIIAGALSVLSANPVNLLCAFAEGQSSGANFYLPNNRIIQHATNVAGFLDTLPELVEQAKVQPKLALLMRLYRASLREQDEDYRMLFQLILLEEASDSEEGETFAERLRAFCTNNQIINLMNRVAADPDIQFSLPDGKDMVDVLVQLRNAVAHNGVITKETLHSKWLLPLLDKKDVLHKLVGENIRFMLVGMVGFKSTEIVATKDGEVFKFRFD